LSKGDLDGKFFKLERVSGVNCKRLSRDADIAEGKQPLTTKGSG